VLGRGLSLPIAAETALKLKETCAIHAEAYSAAEVMHGPLELLGADFPVLVYAPDDATRVSTAEAIARLRRIGARVAVAEPAIALHPFLAPIAMIQTAYRFIEATARARGRDPDRPRHLQKITETV
jgi:glutamine---fructose-6-phosphate transaminase (isomerizing)